MSELYSGFEINTASTILRRGEWVADEYEAGYRARSEGAPESITATPCWQMGWQEAHRELEAFSTQREAEAETDGDTRFLRDGFRLYAAGSSASGGPAWRHAHLA